VLTAVVLAAGSSTRMGTNKLLLPFDGEPLVRRTAREISGAGFDEVLVVVGYQHEEVVAALAGLPIRHARNPEYAEGMGTSFRSAVSSLASEAALFALADQPFLTAADYRRVREAYLDARPAIVSVRYGDVTAPPHLFARELFPELAQLRHGARLVLQRHADRAVVLAFAPDLLMDIDTPEDYERARSRLSSGR
jgi:molybdenum cofactor cytidylyltransferase